MFGLKKNDLIGIVITALVGFTSGMFLYTTHFAKLTAPDPVAEQSELREFSIRGEAYGSCTDACPAFQIQKDGSYRYRYTLVREDGPLFRDGYLPLQTQRDIRRAITDAALAAGSEPFSYTTCNSRTGGVDIRYRISYEGKEYTLDSCATAVDTTGELWTQLSSIWDYLQTVQ